MSWFGDGTLKQDILGWVLTEEDEHKASKEQIIAALADIISYYCDDD